MKPYEEAIDYLNSLVFLLEKMDEKESTEDHKNINIGILLNVKEKIGELINNLQNIS